jgi:hypothetical protein
MEIVCFVYRGGIGCHPIGQNLKPPLIEYHIPLHSLQGNLCSFSGGKITAFFFILKIEILPFYCN